MIRITLYPAIAISTIIKNSASIKNAYINPAIEGIKIAAIAIEMIDIAIIFLFKRFNSSSLKLPPYPMKKSSPK